MLVFFLTAAISLACSLITAYLAEVYIAERIAVLGSFAGLQLSHNPGVAFGIQLPPVWQEIVIITALLLVCFMAWKSSTMKLGSIGYGLIVGGALGNVIDRLPDGVVTDFFQVGTFPIFNVADSCITVGVVFLLAEAVIISSRHQG